MGNARSDLCGKYLWSMQRIARDSGLLSWQTVCINENIQYLRQNQTTAHRQKKHWRFCPLSDLMMIYQLRRQLEDLSFMVLQPEEYTYWKLLCARSRTKPQRLYSKHFEDF